MAVNVEIVGVEACIKAFSQLDGQLRRNANGELRAASKRIASGIVSELPALSRSAAPQASRIAEAARPKSDRYVVVKVPGVKPRLSGLRRTRAAEAMGLGWAVEGGSSYPPFRGPAAGSLVARHRARFEQRAVPEYQRELAAIMRRYGL